MTTFASKVEIFRAAMPLLGLEPPDSIDDQTDEAVIAKAGYEGIVGEALMLHGWSWATKSAALTQDAETGDQPAYSYPLPSDMVLPRFIQLDTYQFEAYVIRGNKMLCDQNNDDGFKIFYTYRAGEQDWPADFAWGIVYKLAAYLARGILNDDNKGDRFEFMGDRKLARAKARDRNRGQTPARDPDPVLVRAWRGSTLTPGFSTTYSWQALADAQN